VTTVGGLLASTATSVKTLYTVYGVIGRIGIGIAYGAPGTRGRAYPAQIQVLGVRHRKIRQEP